MDVSQFRELKSKVDRLILKNKGLKEKQAVIKKENQALKKSLKNNRKLLNNTPVPALVIQDEKVIIANKAFLERSGYQEEEVLDKNYFDLFHPDYRDEAIRLHERRISGKSSPDHYETYLAVK
ncbi:MAG: PAS domain S-box protein, partial [Deltaproteobacteria bacterium]|nr:PAS domain S-box protein [Deltaproteobacteria bacterium]